MSKRHLSKRDSNHIHAKRRASERYGINLTTELHDQVAKAIRTPKGRRIIKAKWIERYSNSRSIWQVEIEGKTLQVVYDKNQRNLVTVLPPDAVAC